MFGGRWSSTYDLIRPPHVMDSRSDATTGASRPHGPDTGIRMGSEPALKRSETSARSSPCRRSKEGRSSPIGRMGSARARHPPDSIHSIGGATYISSNAATHVDHGIRRHIAIDGTRRNPGPVDRVFGNNRSTFSRRRSCRAMRRITMPEACQALRHGVGHGKRLPAIDRGDVLVDEPVIRIRRPPSTSIFIL